MGQMKIIAEDNIRTVQDPAQKDKSIRRKYSKPVLQDLGDLRTLTLGPSVGIVDASGGGWPENTEFPPF